MANAIANQHRQQVPRRVRTLQVHGVTLAVPPAVVTKDATFNLTDYACIDLVGGVSFTILPDSLAVVFKDPVGHRTAYQFDVLKGWEQVTVPTLSVLPEPSGLDLAYCRLAGGKSIYAAFEELPLFGDAVVVDEQCGTVTFTEKGGTSQTITVADKVGESWEIEPGKTLAGNWLLHVRSSSKFNIYCTDEDLGFVERVELRGGGKFRHSLLEPLPFYKDVCYGIVFCRGGKLIFSDAAVPLFLDVFDKWTVRLGRDHRVRSFGDGHLLDHNATELTEYYYAAEWDRFYYMDVGRRLGVAPWVMAATSPQSQTVCGGAIELFSDGNSKVFGRMIYRDAPFSIQGPGNVKAFRKPGSRFMYVVDGIDFELGVFADVVYRNKSGEAYSGWGWGSEVEYPSAKPMSRWVYVLGIGIPWLLFEATQAPQAIYWLVSRVGLFGFAIFLLWRNGSLLMRACERVCEWIVSACRLVKKLAR